MDDREALVSALKDARSWLLYAYEREHDPMAQKSLGDAIDRADKAIDRGPSMEGVRL